MLYKLWIFFHVKQLFKKYLRSIFKGLIGAYDLMFSEKRCIQTMISIMLKRIEY